MKCDQANSWLLMSNSPAELPEPVARHLEICDSCRNTQRQLMQIEGENSSESVLIASQAAGRRFLSRLDQLPERRLIRKQDIRRTIAFICATAAALALIVSGGWFLSRLQQVGFNNRDSIAEYPKRNKNPRMTNNDSISQPQQLERSAFSGVGLALLAPLIDNHVRLAAAENPADRFQLLAELSDALWRQIVREVEAGPTADLLLVSQLYAYVVADALPRGSHALGHVDDPIRREAATALNGRRADAERLAGKATPVVAEVLRRVSDQSDAAAEQIAQGELPQEATPKLAAVNNLLTIVLASNLKLAEEVDPLRRASQSSDIADQLSQTIVFTALGGDEATAEQLGGMLEDVVERGVMVSLARFEPDGEDAPRRAEYEQIKQHNQRAIEVLQRNLERAPAAARKGLQRALEAKRNAHGKGNGPSPGKENGNGKAKGKAKGKLKNT